jgi:uncharacterized membrane protein
MKRIIHSTLGKTLVLCAFAFTLLGVTSAALHSQVSGSTEQVTCATHSVTLTQLDVPNATQTLPSQINDFGHIVGQFQDFRGNHGFLMTGASTIPIDYPQATETAAFGINNRLQIVGNYIDGDGALHGFLRENGVFTSIDHPDATDTAALAINDSGQIIGYYSINGGPFHGYIRSNGVFTTIDFPGASYTEPLGINNNGDIVGERGAGQIGRAFLRKDGVFSDLLVPCAKTATSAAGINNFGHIVGIYDDAAGMGHGFLLINGSSITIDFPGASGPSIDIPDFSGTIASGINNNGQIVGAYVDSRGIIHGFRTTVE